MIRKWGDPPRATTPPPPAPPPISPVDRGTSTQSEPSRISPLIFASPSSRPKRLSPEELDRALREEMAKPHGSRAKLRALVREQSPNGRIPSELRLASWRFLLNVQPFMIRLDPEKSDEVLEEFRREPGLLEGRKRVVFVDAERTRVDLPAFRSRSSHEIIASLLLYFVTQREAQYKQGLNELLAPIIQLHRGERALADRLLPEHEEFACYETFAGFVDRWMPTVYGGTDEEMLSLQSIFRCLDLLLQYHDPVLKRHLDACELKPELYASPWIMTMFAQNLPCDQVLDLWEHMLLEDCSGGFLVFLVVAFLRVNRDVYLRADPSDLPVLMTSRLSYHRRHQATQDHQQQQASASSSSAKGDASGPSTSAKGEGGGVLFLLSQVLPRVLDDARALSDATPGSFLRDLSSSSFLRTRPTTAMTLRVLEKRACLTMSAHDFLRKPVFFSSVVLDVRSRLEHRRAKLSLSSETTCFNVPYPTFNVMDGRSTLEDPANVAIQTFMKALAQVSSLQAKRGAPVYVVLLSSAGWTPLPAIGGEDQTKPTREAEEELSGMDACVKRVVARGVKHVCVLEGGWESLHATLRASKLHRHYLVYSAAS